MWADSLTEDEVDGTLFAADQLISIKWHRLRIGRLIGIPTDHIVYGHHGLEDHLIRFWTDPKTGQSTPIRGLLEKDCPLIASRIIQERLHIIGFICEHTFVAGEIKERAFYCCNPALLKSEEMVQTVLSHWPLIRMTA